MGSIGFKNPQALSSAHAVLGHYNPRLSNFLNPMLLFFSREAFFITQYSII